MTLNELQETWKEWSERNFPGSIGKPSHPALGMAEELCELAEALGPVIRAGLKKEQGIRPESWQEDKVKDAVADLLIYLVDFANKMGFNLQEALDLTVQKVLNRDWNAERAGKIKIGYD